MRDEQNTPVQKDRIRELERRISTLESENVVLRRLSAGDDRLVMRSGGGLLELAGTLQEVIASAGVFMAEIESAFKVADVYVPSRLVSEHSSVNTLMHTVCVYFGQGERAMREKIKELQSEVSRLKEQQRAIQKES